MPAAATSSFCFQRTTSFTGTPILAIRALSSALSSGVLRYSMMVGSMPLSRMSASVQREVPQMRVMIDRDAHLHT